jgi:hypothetical protein
MKEKGFKYISVGFVLCMLVVSIGYGYGIENGISNTQGTIVEENQPSLKERDKMFLTIDQYGKLSSTNAIATAVQLAEVAASNMFARALQKANEDGYAAATNLLNEVAASVSSSPIIFCSPEITSFIAATVFDEATSQLRIFKWEVKNDEKAIKVVNGIEIPCIKCVCGYMFTSDISAAIPIVRYSEEVEEFNASSAVTNYLAEVLVESPIAVTQEPYTTPDGAWTFTNFYEMNIWIPEDRVSGFFRIVVESTATDATGNTLDTVGVKGGFTGECTISNFRLNCRGGYIMANDTGYISVE